MLKLIVFGLTLSIVAAQQRRHHKNPNFNSFDGSYSPNPGSYPANARSHPFNQGSRPTNQGSRPTNQGSRPINQGSNPKNHGSFPANQGSFPANQGSFPANPGSFPANQRSFPANQASYPSNEGVYNSNHGGFSSSKSYPNPTKGFSPSFDQGHASYPKTHPMNNAWPVFPYVPPLKLDTYVSPVSRSYAISPPTSSGEGPVYSSHTSQTFLASIHP